MSPEPYVAAARAHLAHRPAPPEWQALKQSLLELWDRTGHGPPCTGDIRFTEPTRGDVDDLRAICETCPLLQPCRAAAGVASAGCWGGIVKSPARTSSTTNSSTGDPAGADDKGGTR